MRRLFVFLGVVDIRRILLGLKNILPKEISELFVKVPYTLFTVKVSKSRATLVLGKTDWASLITSLSR